MQTPELTARTPRTQRTVSFSDDFEPDSVDPRGAISEPPTARTIPSTAYSSDFESSWQNEEFKKEQSTESVRTSVPRKSKTDRSLSLDAAGRSYSAESFETETDRYELIKIKRYYRPQKKFAKVMFLHLSVSHSVQGGSTWPGQIPPRQVHPRAGTPSRAGHPPGRYTPWQVHPLPPRASTAPRQVHPPSHSACWDMVNKRAVRIPLECILVLQWSLHN